jgi:membrane-associated protease RseP (regulator of RpoE activity)
MLFLRICLNEVLSVSAENRKDSWVTSEPAPAAGAQLPSFPIDFGSLRAMVEYRFTMSDAYVDVNGLPTFVVAQEPMKGKFRELLLDLANHNLLAKIRKVENKLVISVFPKPHLGKPRRIINLLLFLATVVTVGIASSALIFGADPRLTAALFANANLNVQLVALAASILGIVGLHELGHVVAVRHHRMDASLPYFVPAPPPFPFGTFGAVISLRGPPANRDQLFDLGFSGPVAGFFATIGVAILAFLTAPIIAQQQASSLIAANLLSDSPWPHTPLFLELLGYAGLRTVPAGHVLVLTQLAFAAEVGALITFLNILPVWQLDGGHISRATFGAHGHKIFTVAAFGVLVVAGYWGFAILLILFMFLSRRPLEGIEPLDDVSPLSNIRKVLFASALVMLALSFIIF